MTAADAELRDVVRAAARLLPTLVAVVERCRTEPDPGQNLARACGSLVRDYGVLRTRLEDVPGSPLVAGVDRTLYLQQRIVHEASRLAFRPRTPRWAQLARSFGDGLTDSSDELLRLAARL